MTLQDAEAYAARHWPEWTGGNGKAIRTHDGMCRIGPTRPDGSFAAWYLAKTWTAVIRRAERAHGNYDGIAL